MISLRHPRVFHGFGMVCPPQNLGSPSQTTISPHFMILVGSEERAALVVGEAALDTGERPGCIVQLSLAPFF